jgi:hypothetical protein
MHKVGHQNLFRTVLAGIAVLTVAIPSFVSAAGPSVSYPAPRLARLIGPASVAPGHAGSYSLYVTFVDGSTATFDGAPATFSVPANEGTFTGDNLIVSPTYTGAYVLITGKMTSSGYSVTANRTISTQ